MRNRIMRDFCNGASAYRFEVRCYARPTEFWCSGFDRTQGVYPVTVIKPTIFQSITDVLSKPNRICAQETRSRGK